MAGTKHTAGWKVYDGPQISPVFSGIVCMISASDRLIAVITEDETPVDPSTWSDTAHLIAAAPNLLATLEAVANAIGEWARPTGANGMTSPRPDHPLLTALHEANETLSKAKAEGSSHA